MKKTVLFVALLVIVAFAGSALATPPGKNIDYEGGGVGKVVFDGKVHMAAAAAIAGHFVDVRGLR